MRVDLQMFIYETFYECLICDYKCKYENLLADHMSTHTMETYFLCSECQNKCKTKRDLTKHLTTHKNTSKKLSLLCTECDLVCSSRKLLDKHILIHKVETHFQCDRCEKNFKHEEEFRLHMINHTEETVIDAYFAELVYGPSFAVEIKSPCNVRELRKRPRRCTSSSPKLIASNRRRAKSGQNKT